MSRLSSSRPYLLKALYEWILDNDCTPQILVDASMPDVQVPVDYVSNEQIVLNIGPSAVKQLNIDNDGVFFNARFGGVPMDIYVPIIAVLAIYTRETNEGMLFGDEAGSPTPPEPDKQKEQDKQPPSLDKPSLKVVK